MKRINSFLKSSLLRTTPRPVKEALKSWAIEHTKSSMSDPGIQETRVNIGRGFDMSVVQGDIISDCIIASGVWEPKLTELILNDASQGGGLLVEIGANLGYFSLLWAAQSPANRSIAFEPSPRNVSLMWKNIEANDFSRQIHLLPVAAGNKTTLSAFELGPKEQTGWGGIIDDVSTAIALGYVLEVPLDDVLADVGEIAVLKIDVEGYDTRVLEGCRKLLEEKRIGRVYYEQNHPRMNAIGVSPQRAQEFLESVGYDTSILDDHHPDVIEWTANPKAA